MNYLGLTQATASWVLGKPGVLDALHELIATKASADALATAEFVQGSIRLAADRAASVVCFWNVDYSSSTASDPWGFIRLEGDNGLLATPEVSREVLERSVYVVSQRLQGLLLDGAFIHRAWPNGAHTCLAGRGSEARQASIGYIERDVQDGSAMVHSLVSIGPVHALPHLAQATFDSATDLSKLLPTARRLSDPSRRNEPLPPEQFAAFRAALTPYFAIFGGSAEFAEVGLATGPLAIPDREAFRTAGWTYARWISSDSPLSAAQRRLLLGDALDRHPVRITGPAGSGKTLLMQLLALRRLHLAQERARPVRVLYLAHNARLADSLRHRFDVLRADDTSRDDLESVLHVRTLTDYGLSELSLAATQIIDADAHEAKEMQLEILREAIRSTLEASAVEVGRSKVFRGVQGNVSLFEVLVQLTMAEISTAIKGQGLGFDEARYVQSERSLSRFHGVLTQEDRAILFKAFRRYQDVVLDGYGVLDSDDVAISLLGKLRTPIWDLKRRSLGYDHVFVDETQLFNENERRVLPFLTKSNQPYVPIVLALDNAQNLYGQTSAGLAAIGIENASSEALDSIYRSSTSIVRLAFFVIQRSTDLFVSDFPDFTGLAARLPEDADERAASPKLECASPEQASYPRFLLRRVQALRKEDYRSIAVICFYEPYWAPLLGELRKSNLPLHVLENRGERINGALPQVVLSRPAYVGGQEFDAVLIVGAEEGRTPPRVIDNDALALAVEQQAFRELYLAITRARYSVVFALPTGAALSPILESARKLGLIIGSHPGDGTGHSPAPS